MKGILSIAVLVLFSYSYSLAQNGISIGKPRPEESAILDVQSPTGKKGMLIPRIPDRDLIENEVAGLIIYHETTDAFEYFDGTDWLQLVAAPAKIDLDMNANRIVNLSDGVNEGDAVNKRQLDSELDLIYDELELKPRHPHLEAFFDVQEINGWAIAGGPQTRFQYRIEGDGSLIRFKGIVRGNSATSHVIGNIPELEPRFVDGFTTSDFYTFIAVEKSATGSTPVAIEFNGDNGDIEYKGPTPVGQVQSLIFYGSVLTTTK